MEFLFAAIGLVILLLAGDLLVRGAVNSSLRLGLPALIVSLKIATAKYDWQPGIRNVSRDVALKCVKGSTEASTSLTDPMSCQPPRPGGISPTVRSRVSWWMYEVWNV